LVVEILPAVKRLDFSVVLEQCKILTTNKGLSDTYSSLSFLEVPAGSRNLERETSIENVPVGSFDQKMLELHS
jgi:hypothetical protein